MTDTNLTGKIISVPHRNGFWRVLSHKADVLEVLHISDGKTARPPNDFSVVYSWPISDIADVKTHEQSELPQRKLPGRPRVSIEKRKGHTVYLTESEADILAEHLGGGSLGKALRHVLEHCLKSIEKQRSLTPHTKGN